MTRGEQADALQSQMLHVGKLSLAKAEAWRHHLNELSSDPSVQVYPETRIAIQRAIEAYGKFARKVLAIAGELEPYTIATSEPTNYRKENGEDVEVP